jgi:hypothetical protein
MDNKGSVIIYGIMLGLTIIILALALAPSVQEFTEEARNSTSGMDCSNSSISNFDKATCVVTDLNLFYFIGGLIFIAGSVIIAKVVFG